MITIVDYGAGNLRSVENTLAALGATYEITRDPARVVASKKLILPGVGHFGQMMRALDQLSLRQPIFDVARRGTPLLGICLGLQAMFESSEEAPQERGFGLFPGRVVRFAQDVRVPQMGWNGILPRADSRLMAGLGPRPYVYFANSYYAPPCAVTAATCHYTLDFTAALESANVFGVQFHPEKSGPVGMKIVRNFVEL
jgi:imidazole glycerol phosphate synthase glutamine amidotransferase subunit